jgi:transcription elongation GreA/GreB family factor
MDDKLRQEKLKMWRENLAQLEKDLAVILEKKGAAAQEGDLSENAAYTMAIEDAETARVRIEEIKKIIRDLEKRS